MKAKMATTNQEAPVESGALTADEAWAVQLLLPARSGSQMRGCRSSQTRMATACYRKKSSGRR